MSNDGFEAFRLVSAEVALGRHFLYAAHVRQLEVGKWLRSVVQGYFNYHAVPGNIDSLQSFRAQVVWHWSRALQRRSQKSRMPWERFGPLVARWIPSAVILHPRPAMRFNARHLR